MPVALFSKNHYLQKHGASLFLGIGLLLSTSIAYSKFSNYPCPFYAYQCFICYCLDLEIREFLRQPYQLILLLLRVILDFPEECIGTCLYTFSFKSANIFKCEHINQYSSTKFFNLIIFLVQFNYSLCIVTTNQYAYVTQPF